MTAIKKTHLSILLVAALVVAGIILLVLFTSSKNYFRSVEFGLAELSPLGVNGGYAMPASGASDPSNLRFSCTADGSQVTLQWNASQYQDITLKDSLSKLASNVFSVPVAHAGGGGSTESGQTIDAETGYIHHHPASPAVTYNLRVSGTAYSNISGNTRTISISPDTDYDWSIEACAGGLCSNRINGGTFNCPGLPTLDLIADEYLVPFNTGTDLHWTTERADSCAVSGGWTGSRAVNGDEPTGPLKLATTYIMQCTKHSNNQSVTDSVTVNVEYGKCAQMEVEGSSIVRRNSDVKLNWNVGTSDPANCVIRVGQADVSGPLSEYEGTDDAIGANSCSVGDDVNGPETGRGGTFTYKVTGETEFVLDCEDGHNKSQVQVKVLPEFQET